MEFFKKHVRQQWHPNQYYGSPLTVMYTSWYGESPNNKNLKLITFAGTVSHSGFKNRYVSANIN